MNEKAKKVIDLINSGLTHKEVKLKLNIPGTTISSILSRYKDKILARNFEFKNTLIKDYFDKIDSENKAYLLGFFIADGSVCKKSNRFSLNIQEEDIIVLKLFEKELKTPSSCFIINYQAKDGVKRKPQVRLRWTSEYMKNIFFNEYNIKNNKTLDINFQFPFEKIKNNLIRHFIRGFIDGDGSFESKKGVFNLLLISSSLPFLNQLEKLLCFEKSMCFKYYKKIGKTVDYYNVRLCYDRNIKPEQVLKLYNFLYQDSNIFLIRKKEKIESYLKYRGKL
jgi:DNA-binding transcriptional regulator WhiA